MKILVLILICLLFVEPFLNASKIDYSEIASFPQVAEKPYFPLSESGALRVKAEGFDAWSREHHVPYYGGFLTEVHFKDESYEEPTSYGSMGDSCIWTGVYLGSQSLRYAVTNDPIAKQNAIRTVHALHHFLKVTGTKGYIARYWGSQDSLVYHGDAYCASRSDRCHKIDSGEYEGDFWWGQTSKDQYSGWFFGLSLAYDFIDDPDIRNLIRDDVSEVVEGLMTTKWILTDENGFPSNWDSASIISAPYQIPWLTIAYHMTGKDIFKNELQAKLAHWHNAITLVTTFVIPNKYVQYYANHLCHITWYNTLRLGKLYFNPHTLLYLQNLFDTNVHDHVRLAHNALFTAIKLSTNPSENPNINKPYYDELIEDLTDFNSAPYHDYYLPERDPSTYTLEPMTGWIERWSTVIEYLKKIPFFETIMGFIEVKIQAEEGFPIRMQCSSGYIFQRNPFKIEACGRNNPLELFSGLDYLITYWLSSFHNLISQHQ